jgi:hypothetical protein
MLPVLVAMVLAACSSSPTASTGGGDTPATVQVATGDGQSGNPGSILTAPVSVVVKNASGAPVAGVTVTFSVDSGGGSLATLTAKTGSDGTASAGSWTLGANAGTNVVSAHVAALAPIRFHAQALGNSSRPIISGGTVASGGGTLTYQKPGDPLTGLSVTVPAGAYATPTQWSIVADSTVRPTLPAGFSQVGPSLVVSNGQGYADSVMTLTMPMHDDPSMVVMPFYFDPSTGTMEPIPVVASTDTSITLATRHFSGDLMAIPGRSAGAGVRASLHAAFGDVHIVWAQLPESELDGTFSSGFSVGTDNWEFINYGDYIGPDGDCEGMSITELYYYYFVGSVGRPGLYHHFDVSLANDFDDVQGIRFAGSVQGDYDAAWAPGVSQVAILAQEGTAHHLVASQLTAEWIAMTIKLNHQPVLMGLFGPGVGHAVVATAVTIDGTAATVKFADPNFPKTPRYMTFDDGMLEPVTLQINAKSNPTYFTTAYALGVTSEVSMTQVESRWSEFLDKHAGADRYPANYTLEVYDSAADSWALLPDTLRTTRDSLEIRFLCPDCGYKRPGADPADLQYAAVFNDSGMVRLDKATAPATFPLTPGVVSYVVVEAAISPYGKPTDDAAIVDSRSFVVIDAPFQILPATINDKVDSTYTFIASSGGVATANSRFVWQFGDGSDSVAAVGDSTVTHKFEQPGTYAPRVALYDSTGTVTARAVSKVTVAVTVVRGAWQLSSASLSNDLTESLDSIDDKAAQQSINDAMNGITGAPSSTVIFVVDSADCRGIIGETFTGPIALKPLPGGKLFAIGGTCTSYPDIFLGGASVGPIGAGSMSGSVGEGAFGTSSWTRGDISSFQTSIEATMGGGQLNGAVSATVDYFEGAATYTLSFTATQIFPVPTPTPGLRAAVHRR